MYKLNGSNICAKRSLSSHSGQAQFVCFSLLFFFLPFPMFFFFFSTRNSLFDVDVKYFIVSKEPTDLLTNGHRYGRMYHKSSHHRHQPLHQSIKINHINIDVRLLFLSIPFFNNISNTSNRIIFPFFSLFLNRPFVVCPFPF